MHSPRVRRAGFAGLLRYLMEKRSGFRCPFMILLGLACVCSFALTVGWHRLRKPYADSFIMQFNSTAHVQGLNESNHKYFHEAGPHQPGDDEQLGHYDIRFFKGKLQEENKRDVQVHLVRAYLDTFRRLGLETWIAHGTLLGWWWNQSLLPWDWDVDAQVSEAVLFHMADHFNYTFHKYTTTIGDDQKSTTTIYLLDVNPHFTERENGDGMNIIDARWINMENGLYLDITGLSELDPVGRPGVVSCKNFHDYNTEDLYPLKDTEYEGVDAKVPAAYKKLLEEEYGEQSLTAEQYESHKWDPLQRIWVELSESDCRSDATCWDTAAEILL